MNKHYTVEEHTQILIALMKFHGIKKIVASPGTTNICLVGSLQNDSFFEIYSSVDERSAAYMACGLARESGEPVALSCTGATASRNYISGLTEAYYSNLPIVAITSTQHPGRIGQLMPQVIDRTNPLNDIVKKSILVNTIHTNEDKWATEVAINDALLELKRHGGGPVHINLVTTYSTDFSIKNLPTVRGIQRFFWGEVFPDINGYKIVINVGQHNRWDEKLTSVVDEFCEKYNAVVVCEHISNYKGKYGVYPSLLANQDGKNLSLLEVDIMIHIGQVLGFGAGGFIKAKEVWRVHPDGEVRDTFQKLTKVFEMSEYQFFQYFCAVKDKNKMQLDYFKQFYEECVGLEKKIPELPFSNPWIAQNTVNKLPYCCELHLGILNSLRAWSLFHIDSEKKIEIYSNTGGFGIDGLTSTLFGSALSNPDKIFIGVIGDLAFFYDMNVLGNRHMCSNVRLMMINNGCGTEFRNYNHPANRFSDDADLYMAAAGHFGNKSHDLVKHYAEDLGFEYITANNKNEYLDKINEFLNPEKRKKPILFEVFTNSKDESDALKILYHIDTPTSTAAKEVVKNVLGDKGIATLKKIIKK